MPAMCNEKEFYNALEEPIREVVRLLRNCGVNTTCSCGHEMYIEIELGNHLDEVETIATVLAMAGYKEFKIECTLQKPPDGLWVRRCTIWLNQWM